MQCLEFITGMLTYTSVGLHTWSRPPRCHHFKGFRETSRLSLLLATVGGFSKAQICQNLHYCYLHISRGDFFCFRDSTADCLMIVNCCARLVFKKPWMSQPSLYSTARINTCKKLCHHVFHVSIILRSVFTSWVMLYRSVKKSAAREIKPGLFLRDAVN